MFITQNSNEIDFPFIFSTEGEKTWSCVELALNVPWFFVSYEYEHNEQEMFISTNIMLSSVQQLLILKNNLILKITGIYLVSPSYLNKTGYWKLQSLTEIKVGEEKFKIKKEEYVRQVYVYIDSDGTEYVYPELINSNSKLMNISSLIKF